MPKFTLKILLALFLTILSSSCSTSPKINSFAPDENESNNFKVSVVSHGWHTGIIIPAREVYRKIPQLKARFPNAPYLEFGWGDKGFYQANEITPMLVIKAIFWPTASVMHIVALPEEPENYFPESEVKKLCIGKNALDSLLQFLANSFKQTSSNHLITLQTGIYGDSQFYKGAGKYYLMNTCNKWTAKGLKSAGVEISTLFKLTASSITDALSELEKEGKQGCSSP